MARGAPFDSSADVPLPAVSCWVATPQPQAPDSAGRKGRHAVLPCRCFAPAPPLPSVDSEKDPPAIAEGRSVFFAWFRRNRARGDQGAGTPAAKLRANQAGRDADRAFRSSWQPFLQSRDCGATCRGGSWVLRSMDVNGTRSEDSAWAVKSPRAACQDKPVDASGGVDLYPKPNTVRRVGRRNKMGCGEEAPQPKHSISLLSSQREALTEASSGYQFVGGITLTNRARITKVTSWFAQR